MDYEINILKNYDKLFHVVKKLIYKSAIKKCLVQIEVSPTLVLSFSIIKQDDLPLLFFCLSPAIDGHTQNNWIDPENSNKGLKLTTKIHLCNEHLPFKCPSSNMMKVFTNFSCQSYLSRFFYDFFFNCFDNPRKNMGQRV